MTEGNQKTENWLANRTYCSPDPTKLVLLIPIIAENKRKLTKEIFYLINITILNCFEQCKIEMKISTLHNKKSTVILNHQIDFFFFFFFFFLQSAPIWLSH